MAVSIGLAAVGVGLAIYGAVKKSQAEKKAKANMANRPNYQALPEDQSELRLAESRAGQGMSDAARQAYQNNADRGLAATTSAIMRGGGDANAVGNAYDKYQQGIANQSIYDDQVRLANLNNLSNTYSKYNARRSAENDKDFQVNKYAPWADKQQLYTQQIAGGQQTMQSGINIGLQGATGAANSYMANRRLNNMDPNQGQGAMPGGGSMMGTGASGPRDMAWGETGSTGSSGGFGNTMGTGSTMEAPIMRPYYQTNYE